jgi:hypothetical protein
MHCYGVEGLRESTLWLSVVLSVQHRQTHETFSAKNWSPRNK